MIIQQFEDKQLSHYSYAILSETDGKVILIDPTRHTKPYFDFAKKHKAAIAGIIETHPHADFISSHFELHQSTGAPIYCSKLLGAAYAHQAFDRGDEIELGEIKFRALNTPGHSPDSISIVLEGDGKDKAVFTGDTLFIGDCGRPDLREKAGNLQVSREKLAAEMYHTLRNELMSLADEVIVYPAHGAGTLCGKSLSEEASSTIGKEKAENWSLQPMEEADFVATLLSEQPFIPRYFGYDVEQNRKGVSSVADAKKTIVMAEDVASRGLRLEKSVVIVDTRSAEQYRENHLFNSINIMADGKFETWLGSLIIPGEPFYLAAESHAALDEIIERVMKIGYESYIKEAFVLSGGNRQSKNIDLEHFKSEPEEYTILDIRNKKEVAEKTIFSTSINIPLDELRSRLSEISGEKPIVVHCAGGYRSAAGASIIEGAFPDIPVFDLSTSIKDFEGDEKAV
ncbi:MAG: MBL fold metallo-hydrolase [Bacteroidota bacterium]